MKKEIDTWKLERLFDAFKAAKYIWNALEIIFVTGIIILLLNIALFGGSITASGLF